MPGREPTIAELAAEEQRLLRLRGERAIAADAAAREEAKQKAEMIERLRFDPNAPRVEFETGNPRLTDYQVREMVAVWRARYGEYDDELRAIQEQRLKAALQADGYTVPELPTGDRLRALKARQL
jgi:hypothetical protein